MVYFRDVRESLLFAYDDNLINDEEFLLLFDLNTSKNLDYPYWKYQPFDLNLLSDDECRTYFRFYRNDVYLLNEKLHIPEEITCYNGSVFSGLEAFCALLKRFAYPCRYADMVPIFGRPVPELSLMSNYMVDYLYNTYETLLHTFNQPWLAPRQLEIFAAAISNKGAPLDHCWGFIDGTVRPVCRPGRNQRVLYNGHKRVHAIKFQSIVAPNGMIANLYGPVEGRRHDSGMLAMSELLQQLQLHSRSPNGNPLCVYGDPAYPLRVQLQGPFKGNLNQQQKDYNKAMSQVRTSVEWVFGDISKYFAFIDFKKNLKIQLSAVGKMYITCALLTNAHTCLYKSMTSTYFGIEPPHLEDYFL